MHQTTCSKLLTALLLLAALTALQAADEKSTVSLFTDWLLEKQPGKTAALASSYQAVETSDVCMRETSVEGCSCYGRRSNKSCCYSYSVDTQMTCCDKREKPHKSVESLKEETIDTSKCTYTQSYLEDTIGVVEYDDTVMKIGTFYGQCTMTKDAGMCGSPACEGMSVTIQGDILKASKVAFEGRPGDINKSDKCKAMSDGDCKDSSAQVAGLDPISRMMSGPHKLQSKVGPKQYEHDSKFEKEYEYFNRYPEHKHGEHDYDKYDKKDDDKGEDRYEKHEKREKYDRYDDDDDDEKDDYKKGDRKGYDFKHSKYEKTNTKKFYMGSAEVFMGTFYVTSRVHDVKHNTGVFQSVKVVTVDTDKSLEEPPASAYVARPNEVYFRFIKSGGPYKS